MSTPDFRFERQSQINMKAIKESESKQNVQQAAEKSKKSLSETASQALRSLSANVKSVAHYAKKHPVQATIQGGVAIVFSPQIVAAAVLYGACKLLGFVWSKSKETYNRNFANKTENTEDTSKLMAVKQIQAVHEGLASSSISQEPPPKEDSKDAISNKMKEVFEVSSQLTATSKMMVTPKPIEILPIAISIKDIPRAKNLEKTGTLTKKMKAENKLPFIINEIKSTENTHFMKLNALRNDLNLLKTSHHEFEQYATIVDEHCDQIDLLNQKLSQVPLTIDDIATHFDPSDKDFAKYVDTMKKFIIVNQALNSELKKLKDKQLIHALSLDKSELINKRAEIESGIILPVQRIPRLRLMILDLAETSMSARGSADKKLENTLELMSSLALEINKEKGEADDAASDQSHLGELGFAIKSLEHGHRLDRVAYKARRKFTLGKEHADEIHSLKPIKKALTELSALLKSKNDDTFIKAKLFYDEFNSVHWAQDIIKHEPALKNQAIEIANTIATRDETFALNSVFNTYLKNFISDNPENLFDLNHRIALNSLARFSVIPKEENVTARRKNQLMKETKKALTDIQEIIEQKRVALQGANKVIDEVAISAFKKRLIEQHEEYLPNELSDPLNLWLVS